MHALFEKKGHIGIITMNRPEALNALSPEMICQLADHWKEVRDNPDIRVAIVTGAGPKSFCSGADLGQLIPLFNGSRTPQNEFEQRVVDDRGLTGIGILRDFDTVKPVVAAVNGFAVAGGCEMLQGTDIRVASEKARFGVQEVKWAIFPGGGSTVRLPRQIPYCRAMELLITGDLLSAQEAFDVGLINKVVPQDKVMDAAMEYATKLAKNGPIAVQAIRRSARECIGYPEKVAMEMEGKFSAPVFKTEDAVEGPRAFMEKREPVFKGR
ncbi:MAG TPA: enoyl-CoA hydratase-related protein [Alphaproteobacteria bacterium]|nr:enoyl-CoA hydratase-related protein [Alphaproteobacteria bacterium]